MKKFFGKILGLEKNCKCNCSCNEKKSKEKKNLASSAGVREREEQRTCADATTASSGGLGRQAPIKKVINFDILTLFPESFSALDTSIMGRAQKNNLISIKKHNLRDWSLGNYNQVDDTPYGGGAGMVLMIEPLYNAWKDITKNRKVHTVLLSAKGKKYTQRDAERLSKMQNILFVCGHYEGVDERFTEHCVDEEFSIGEYVLSGGELGASIILDSTARLVDGVLGKNASHEEESYSEKLDRKREYPHYTKPAEFNGWEVPEVLRNGDHAKIENWKKQNLK